MYNKMFNIPLKSCKPSSAEFSISPSYKVAINYLTIVVVLRPKIKFSIEWGEGENSHRTTQVWSRCVEKKLLNWSSFRLTPETFSIISYKFRVEKKSSFYTLFSATNIRNYFISPVSGSFCEHSVLQHGNTFVHACRIGITDCQQIIKRAAVCNVLQWIRLARHVYSYRALLVEIWNWTAMEMELSYWSGNSGSGGFVGDDIVKFENV